MAKSLGTLFTGPLGGGGGTQLKGPGVKFTIGSSNISFTPAQAFEELASQVEELKERLGGHLSEPFSEIASYLVEAVQARLSSGYFDDEYRSAITNKVRKAKGLNVDDPTLVGTGRLRKSIKPVYTGRRNEDGGNRIVNVLRIGSVGVPYARTHLEGGTWSVPGFKAPDTSKGKEGYFYPDMDGIPGVKLRNEAFYGKKWQKIQGYTRETYNMDIPQRDFLAFTEDDNNMINKILVKHITKAGIVPF